MLNKQQQLAVDSKSMKKLIIASAGSGKSTTLVQIIKKDTERISPENMVAITFTRNAANELKEKVHSAGVSELNAETIHGFCLKILTKYIHEIEWEDNFVLFDQDDRNDILKYINESQQILPKTMTLEKGLKDDKYKTKILRAYYSLMQEYNEIDLNMIIDLTVMLLENQDVLEEVKKQYKAFYIDEFQDTYAAQLTILKAIDPELLVVIGDPDQSIYEWNDAKPEYIINTQYIFPGMEMFKLEINYRSTHQIVNMAESLIKNNIKRIDKTAKATRDGVPVEFNLDNETLKDQINIIAENLSDPFKHNAIICRKNGTALAIADQLHDMGYPVNLVLSSADIMKKEHIKSLLYISKSIVNSNDDYSVMKSICFLHGKALNEIMPYYEHAGQTGIPLSTHLKASNKDFYSSIDKLYQLNDKVLITDAYESMKSIFSEFNIISRYSDQHRETRLSELEEFRKEVKKWRNVQSFKRLDTSLAAFIRWVMIRDIQDTLKKDTDAITIMTVHGSKGLEFHKVFIPNFFQKEFPMTRSDNIEEERRLLYVAITRAKEELMITSCNTKKLFNGFTQATEPSQFLKEIYKSDNKSKIKRATQ